MVMGFEEFEEDDDIREEFACPFCLEYFDIVGLCGHIDDEHPVEAKNGARLREAASWEKHVLLKILGDALEALEGMHLKP
ncbi:hypothetical protein Vadar_011551 [Vaccinium darrowii]|uniref:Uncharacterized protein n=1 Tax=Vaccinium darrowii TaxID=229202 RepID=A0ACB7X902_9ERIC|nr:hypothetical protein Vadar_011551 [Vaccinium darrowii]